MERDHEHTSDSSETTLLEALGAAKGGSVVDALFSLPADAGDNDATSWERVVSGGVQAALARQMRAMIAEEKGSRDAA